jgi:chromosome transmission fidelity protein 4
LPADEQPVLLASGGKSNTNEFEVEDASVGSVVVATTRGYIRFFTGSGIQRYIWRMGEEVVSMVAGKEMVFLVHREGGTSLDG